MIRPRRAAHHLRDRALGEPERAGEVGVDHRRPVVLGHPHQQPVGGDPGVGDQHLDRAVRRLDLGERRLDGRGVGDVAAHVEAPVRCAAAAGGHRDLVALGDERLGDRPADARGCRR